MQSARKQPTRSPSWSTGCNRHSQQKEPGQPFAGRALPSLPTASHTKRRHGPLKPKIRDLTILQAEAAPGMYKKPVEAMAREFRFDPLPAEVRTVVIAAWTRGGLLPRAAIEQMVPERIPQESLPPLSSPA
jgi:hypothetical protein